MFPHNRFGSQNTYLVALVRLIQPSNGMGIFLCVDHNEYELDLSDAIVLLILLTLVKPIMIDKEKPRYIGTYVVGSLLRAKCLDIGSQVMVAHILASPFSPES